MIDFMDILKKNFIVAAFGIGLLLIFLVLLGSVPGWTPVEPKVEIISAQVSQAMEDGDIVEITVRWATPFTKSCFLANDIRPSGAELGTPETDEWNQNHLIRYNLNTGQMLAEYWINIEILQQRENTQTFRYKLAPASKPYDFYTELRCDDKSLAKAGPFRLEA